MANVPVEKNPVPILFYVFIGIRWREIYVKCENGSFLVKKVALLEWVSL